MKLSISNIAWDPIEDENVFKLMQQSGFNGLEIAPTKLFKNPTDVDFQSIQLFLERIKNYNINLTAMQSLLFNRPDLKLFNGSRSKTEQYLKNLIDLASKLGVRVLVFGSPKNRSYPDGYNKISTYDSAVLFFKEIGSYASKFNIFFCIEPNSIAYDCNFITNTYEAIELIRDVDSDGFRLHVDSAVMCLNDEPIEKTIIKALPFMEHFHISEPYLDLITNNKTNHKRFADVLKDNGYEKWVSIEMRNNIINRNLEPIHKCMEYIRKLYF